jgi:3-oxoacyl-[acyl-carrier protein] reductase
MSAGPLEGAAALVTGCGRQNGLGRAVALALGRAGADLAVTDLVPGGTRNALESEETGWRGLPYLVEELGALGSEAVAVVGDVGSKRDAEQMVAVAVDALGRVDILVNNAGAPHGADRTWTWDVPEAACDLGMRVNVNGPFFLSSAIARHLLARGAPGRIVNIASLAGQRGYAQRAAYCASKAALISLTQTMALELAPHGVTVNAVCPGPVATARHTSRLAREQTDPVSAAAPPPTPVGRVAHPDEIARAVLFLADPAASFITGECVNVDGGL